MAPASPLGTLVRILLGLLPVSLFLCGLVYMDSYKLVRMRRILQLLAAGCLSAALSYGLNHLILTAPGGIAQGAPGLDPASAKTGGLSRGRGHLRLRDRDGLLAC